MQLSVGDKYIIKKTVKFARRPRVVLCVLWVWAEPLSNGKIRDLTTTNV